MKEKQIKCCCCQIQNVCCSSTGILLVICLFNIFFLYFQKYDAQSPGWPNRYGEDASLLCHCGNTSSSPRHVTGCEADCGCPWPCDQSHIWLHTDHLKDPRHPPLWEPRLQEPHHRYKSYWWSSGVLGIMIPDTYKKSINLQPFKNISIFLSS